MSHTVTGQHCLQDPAVICHHLPVKGYGILSTVMLTFSTKPMLEVKLVNIIISLNILYMPAQLWHYLHHVWNHKSSNVLHHQSWTWSPQHPCTEMHWNLKHAGKTRTQATHNPHLDWQCCCIKHYQQSHPSKCTNAMDINFHWLHDCSVKPRQFCFFWRSGSANLADYWTKHHLGSHHHYIGSEYITPFQKVLELCKCHCQWQSTMCTSCTAVRMCKY